MADYVLETMLTEYRSLRAEILECLTNRLRIISFGLATVGVLTVSALGAFERSYKQVASLLLAVMIPLSCLLIQIVWLSEIRRGRRASFYLRWLESRVNRHLNSQALLWEGIAFFFSVGCCISAGLGAYVFIERKIDAVLWATVFALIQAFRFIPMIKQLHRYDAPWPSGAMESVAKSQQAGSP